MPQPRAQRTLVKSPPELWAEVSDLQALARHLGEFGDIRITRLEPETTVAWEGDRASGTVELEPSGWGTKVTLTAELAAAVAPAEPEAIAPAEPEPVAPEPEATAPAESEPVAEEPEAAAEREPLAPEPEAAAPAEPVPAAPEPEATAGPEPVAEEPRPGFFARLFGRRRQVAPVVAQPEPVASEPEPELEPATIELARVEPEPVAVEPEPEPVAPAEPALDGDRAEAILAGVLDDLGSAHHRPFSRS